MTRLFPSRRLIPLSRVSVSRNSTLLGFVALLGLGTAGNDDHTNPTLDTHGESLRADVEDHAIDVWGFVEARRFVLL